MYGDVLLIPNTPPTPFNDILRDWTFEKEDQRADSQMFDAITYKLIIDLSYSSSFLIVWSFYSLHGDSLPTTKMLLWLSSLFTLLTYFLTYLRLLLTLLTLRLLLAYLRLFYLLYLLTHVFYLLHLVPYWFFPFVFLPHDDVSWWYCFIFNTPYH